MHGRISAKWRWYSKRLRAPVTLVPVGSVNVSLLVAWTLDAVAQGQVRGTSYDEVLQGQGFVLYVAKQSNQPKIN